MLIDVLELERVPATYHVDVDATGELCGCERLRRYTRGTTDMWRLNQPDALLEPVAAMTRAVALLDAPQPTEERRAYLVPLDQVEAVRAAVAASRRPAQARCPRSTSST